MRSVLQLMVAGVPLVGTRHAPPVVAGGGAGGELEAGAVGLLWVNFGHLPRAGPGDLAARLADHAAAHGYPAFRFDMPGLGDSPGAVPEYRETLFGLVESGAHAALAAALAEELTRRFALRGLVLAGLCGGAITALHAAGVRPGPAIRGLILLEPEFALTPAPEPARVWSGPVSIRESLATRGRARRALGSARAWWRLVSGQSDYGFHYRWVRAQVRRAVERLRGQALPGDANRPLIERWRQVAASGLPMLVLVAGDADRRRLDAAYLGAPRVPPGSGVRWVEVAGADHLFSTGPAPAAVAGSMADWLTAIFPRGAAGPRPTLSQRRA